MLWKINLWDAVGLFWETTAVSHTYITTFLNVKSWFTVRGRSNGRTMAWVSSRSCSARNLPVSERLVRSEDISVVWCRREASGQPWVSVSVWNAAALKQRTTVDLGREWSVQCWPTAPHCCRGRPSSRGVVTWQPGVVHTLLMLSCRASFLIVADKLLLPNELLSDELLSVG